MRAQILPAVAVGLLKLFPPPWRGWCQTRTRRDALPTNPTRKVGLRRKKNPDIWTWHVSLLLSVLLFISNLVIFPVMSWKMSAVRRWQSDGCLIVPQSVQYDTRQTEGLRSQLIQSLSLFFFVRFLSHFFKVFDSVKLFWPWPEPSSGSSVFRMRQYCIRAHDLFHHFYNYGKIKNNLLT